MSEENGEYPTIEDMNPPANPIGPFLSYYLKDRRTMIGGRRSLSLYMCQYSLQWEVVLALADHGYRVQYLSESIVQKFEVIVAIQAVKLPGWSITSVLSFCRRHLSDSGRMIFIQNLMGATKDSEVATNQLMHEARGFIVERISTEEGGGKLLFVWLIR